MCSQKPETQTDSSPVIIAAAGIKTARFHSAVTFPVSSQTYLEGLNNLHLSFSHIICTFHILFAFIVKGWRIIVLTARNKYILKTNQSVLPVRQMQKLTKYSLSLFFHSNQCTKYMKYKRVPHIDFFLAEWSFDSREHCIFHIIKCDFPSILPVMKM